MLFIPISVKVSLTLGAVLGATVAIVKNKDDLLDIVVECLHNSANQLNNFKSSKYKAQRHQIQESFNAINHDLREEEEEIVEGENGEDVSGVIHRDYHHGDPESELTTPESSDWELLSDGKNSPLELSCNESYETLEMISIDTS